MRIMLSDVVTNAFRGSTAARRGRRCSGADAACTCCGVTDSNHIGKDSSPSSEGWRSERERTERASNLHSLANVWAPAARLASYIRSGVLFWSALYALCSAEVSKPAAVSVTTSAQRMQTSQQASQGRGSFCQR